MERKINLVKIIIFFLLIFNAFGKIGAQSIIKGVVKDAKTGEAVIGATVLIKGTTQGTVTDWDGTFVIKTNNPLPANLEVRYSGFATKEIAYTSNNKNIDISLEEESIQIEVVEVKGQRISDKQKSSPLTVESMDLLAIKETPAANFYDGLGSLKDVDLTTASLGFTVINTRGFNSTSPVRSLQIIDGVDNQSPGLNFSLGNFLGASELDVNKVDLIVGASSAFYGPNAFNGVISMETKNPFIHKGLSMSAKLGERSLFEGGLRWADAIKNKNKQEFFAYKVNLYSMRANDWQANNYDPVFGTKTNSTNPGGYDAVNIYGDEYEKGNDYTDKVGSHPGLGEFHRQGYREVDLVDYESKNLKSSVAAHFRTNPSKIYDSPEIVLSSSYGGGTTVYQGDNRYSLKNIRFYQQRAELIKKDRYFIRAYYTNENSGDSYDPYFTALLLQRNAKSDRDWSLQYSNFWATSINPIIRNNSVYPKISDFTDPKAYFEAINNFLFTNYKDSISIWHSRTKEFANASSPVLMDRNFLIPGSKEFKEEFDKITGRIAYSEGGTKFYDKSSLAHCQGEYIFKNIFAKNLVNNFNLTIGASGRMFFPNSKGSILLDTGSSKITTYEYGLYLGPTVRFLSNKLTLNFTTRLDKHQNFNYVISPAASMVYQTKNNNYFRLSLSSAIRNPTLTDQYLHYNVGRAILIGNINGFKDLITINSFIDFLNSSKRDTLKYFNVPSIQPEKVKTFEIGYRTFLFKTVYADMSYYFSRYDDFIGYQFGITANIPRQIPIPSDVQVYRVSSNAKDIVTTQGFSIGLNYYFKKYFLLRGNYSWNVLNTKTDDPIVPAFNTPEHKFNIGLSGRNIKFFNIANFGFNINYKWIDEFIYEGSPQFTGIIPSYDLTDLQVNWLWAKQNTTFKLGASNIFNQKNIQTYGGPYIGRLGYISIAYDLKI